MVCVVWRGVEGATYFGTELGSFKPHAHDVQGKVYAVDDRTLYVKQFSYDGQGPDAYFWGGSTSKPDATGFIIPDEKGRKSPLQEYRESDLLLRLPAGKTLRNIKWISVWCRKFNANFGEIVVPSDLVIPAPVEIGRIPTFEHGVSSGPVMVVDTHTLLLPDFTYDGKGPAAYFWASRGSRQHPRGLRLADENGSFSPLPKYTGKTVVISLPPEHTIQDFDWFGVWCEEARVDFGSVQLPPDIVVPPSPRTLGIELEYKLNCEVLRDDLGYEVRWIMDGEDIVLQLVARLERGEYMSFGLSKNDSHSVMEKADAIVAWLDKRGKGHAVDYHLASKEQCVGQRGSCPDSKLPDGRDSVTLLNAADVNGYTMVTVKRPQVGMDERYDQHVYSDGPQAIVWAIGPLNDKTEVSYHGGMRSEGDVYIDFARSPQWNCPQPADATESLPPNPTTSSTTKKPSTKKPATKRPSTNRKPPRYASRSGDNVRASESSKHDTRWNVRPIVCPEDRTLRAQIGPSGGKKGFQAITGAAGWGIAWYINGLLMPEITLERGQSYTFVVEGGNDPENSARTHPLYITDDPEGGLEHKTLEERKKVKVFAGASEDRRGRYTPTGKGRLCEWKLPRGLEPEAFETFDEFQESLELKCERGRPGRFVFRPDFRTPDTLYYQCFTHRHLGWKIHVVDSCEGLRHEASVQHVSNITYNALVSDFKRGGAQHHHQGNDGLALNLYHDPPSTSKMSSKHTTLEKKRYFFTTTSSPATTRRHPVTMESFHLGDVVLPFQQRGNYYYSQKAPPASNTYSRQTTKVRTTYQRPPQVSDLKDTLQWWNDPAKESGRRRPELTAVVGVSQKSKNPTIRPQRDQQRDHRPAASTRQGHQVFGKQQQNLIPVLVVSAKDKTSTPLQRGNVQRPRASSPQNKTSSLVPLVLEKGVGRNDALRQVLSLLNNGGSLQQGIRVINLGRVRRGAAPHHHGNHSHEDHDHHHEGHDAHHTEKSRGLKISTSVLFVALTIIVSLTLALPG